MERKDLIYFNQYFKALPLTLLLLLFNRIILLGAITLVMAFFFLDSTLDIKGFWKSVKNGVFFTLYFPVILIIDLIYWIFGAIITFSLFLPFSGTLFIPTEITLLNPTEILLITISNLLMLILRFIQLSFIATFYLRIKHAFPDLFGAK
jgi:hypothetical protein